MPIENHVGDRFEIRDAQEECIDAVADARHRGVRSAYVNAATAFGKTYVAARDFQNVLEENPNARALYLCHQNNILRKARKTFGEVLGPDTSLGYVFGGHMEDQAQVVFASFQTMNAPFGDQRLYEALDPEEFDYIIDDESHHAPADTYRRVLEYFDGFLLGLTPVPDRRDGQDILDIFEEEVYRKTLEEAMAEGLLSPVRYKTYTDHIRNLKELSRPLDALNLEELNRTLFLPRRDEEIAEIIFDELANIDDPHVMVFCQSIEHAERMARLLPDAVAIHSELKPQDESSRFEAFEAGQIPIACVVDKFNEGVDLPDVNMVAFLRSTTSQRIWLQQLGRGLRKTSDKDEVVVIDLVADIERIDMIIALQRRVKAIQQEKQIAYEERPPIEFDFQEEAADVAKLIQDVRDRIARRKAELQAAKTLKHAEIEFVPEPIEPLTLDVAADYRDYGARRVLWRKEEVPVETKELSPKDTFMLKTIFNSENGGVDEYSLQKAYKAQFDEKIKLAQLREMLDSLCDAGLISRIAAARKDWASHERVWRLNPQTVEAMIAIEPYRTMHSMALSSLRELVRGRFTQAGMRQDDEGLHLRKIKTSEGQTWLMPLTLKRENIYARDENDALKVIGSYVSGHIRTPRFLESDITNYEMGGTYNGVRWGSRGREAMPGELSARKELLIFEDRVEIRWSVDDRMEVTPPEGLGNPARHNRMLTPGEITAIERELASYDPDEAIHG